VADLGPVEVVTRHVERCGWCRMQLATLFDIDLRDERLTFLAPGWQRLRIAMCNRCKVYAPLFTEVDGEGRSHWSDLNGHPRNLNLQRRGWRFPMWEHDISHPRCPKCARWMIFIGQVMTGDALDHGEGTTYAFLCQECGLAATAYEQT